MRVVPSPGHAFDQPYTHARAVVKQGASQLLELSPQVFNYASEGDIRPRYSSPTTDLSVCQGFIA